MFKLVKKTKGFTLIELIVVIAILGILAAVLIPRFTGFQERARRTQALVDAKQIATAIDAFQVESATGAWPAVTAAGDTSGDKTTVLTTAGLEPLPAGKTLAIAANGAFTYTVTIGETAYTAGRIAGGPVVSPAP